MALLGTAIALPLSATLSTGAHVAGLHGVALVERPGARSAADDPERSRLAGRSDAPVAVLVLLSRLQGQAALRETLPQPEWARGSVA